MKKRLKRNNIAVLAGLLLIFIAAACNRTNKKDEKVAVTAQQQVHVHDEYTCPMHPQIKEDHPGSCPICGMDLVKKSSNEKDTVQLPSDLTALVKSPNQMVVANVSIVQPVEKSFEDSLKAPGVITYDTKMLYSVAARFGGRIEKLYLKYQYQPIKKGQVLASIYSPELVTAQRELLYILKTDKANQQLVQGAVSKLRLLGVTANQVSQLMNAGKVSYSFPIYSPYSGYLTLNTSAAPQAMASASTAATDDESMGGSSGTADGTSGGSYTAQGNQPAALREGAYVAAGQTLFSLVNPEQLWVETKVSSVQAAAYKKGLPAEIYPDGGKSVKGTVRLVQPFYDEGSSFATVRIGFDNAISQFRIGQLVQVAIHKGAQTGNWIPQEAVLDLGDRKIAFLKRNHSFVPVTIITGAAVKGWVQLKKGLNNTDHIAANAQYLVDSESFIETEEAK